MAPEEEVGIDYDSELVRVARRALDIQDEAYAALPLLAHAQSLEMMTNLKPVLIIPEGSALCEVEEFYGYKIVGAKVPTAYVAFPPR